MIYINGGKSSYDTYTLLAHEGFPGHLYQHEYFRRKETQELRHVLNFSAYSEGWATYVENRSYQFEENGLEKGMGEILARNSSITKGMHFWISGLITRAGTGKRPLILSASFFLSATKRQMRFMTV